MQGKLWGLNPFIDCSGRRYWTATLQMPNLSLHLYCGQRGGPAQWQRLIIWEVILPEWELCEARIIERLPCRLAERHS